MFLVSFTSLLVPRYGIGDWVQRERGWLIGNFRLVYSLLTYDHSKKENYTWKAARAEELRYLPSSQGLLSCTSAGWAKKWCPLRLTTSSPRQFNAHFQDLKDPINNNYNLSMYHYAIAPSSLASLVKSTAWKYLTRGVSIEISDQRRYEIVSSRFNWEGRIDLNSHIPHQLIKNGNPQPHKIPLKHHHQFITRLNIITHI